MWSPSSMQIEDACEALLGRQVALDLDARTAQHRNPFLVEAEAPHRFVGGVVLARPCDELQMLRVHGAAFINGVSITLPLARHDARHADLMRNVEEDRQLEAR